MKTKFLCFLLVAFIISACNQKKSPAIEGAWKLIYSQTITGNTSVVDFPGKSDMDLTKIWSGDHFMFVARYKIDTTIEDWYGVGTYKLEGNRYEEIVWC